MSMYSTADFICGVVRSLMPHSEKHGLLFTVSVEAGIRGEHGPRRYTPPREFRKLEKRERVTVSGGINILVVDPYQTPKVLSQQEANSRSPGRIESLSKHWVLVVDHDSCWVDGIRSQIHTLEANVLNALVAKVATVSERFASQLYRLHPLVELDTNTQMVFRSNPAFVTWDEVVRLDDDAPAPVKYPYYTMDGSKSFLISGLKEVPVSYKF